jgi:hypothetical protein
MRKRLPTDQQPLHRAERPVEQGDEKTFPEEDSTVEPPWCQGNYWVIVEQR